MTRHTLNRSILSPQNSEAIGACASMVGLLCKINDALNCEVGEVVNEVAASHVNEEVEMREEICTKVYITSISLKVASRSFFSRITFSEGHFTFQSFSRQPRPLFKTTPIIISG